MSLVAAHARAHTPHLHQQVPSEAYQMADSQGLLYELQTLFLGGVVQQQIFHRARKAAHLQIRREQSTERAC